MATDGRRRVEIEINVTGDLQTRVREISQSIQGLVKAITPLVNAAKGVSAIAKSLSEIKSTPDLGAFSKQVSELSKVDTAKLSSTASALREFSKIKSFPDMTGLSNSIKILKESITGVRPETIQKLGVALHAYNGVKLPSGDSLASFAKGLKNFQGISINASIIKSMQGIADTLPRFAGVTKGIPTQNKLQDFAKGIKSIASIPPINATQLKGLNTLSVVLPRFAGASKGIPTQNKLQGFASGIRSLAKIKLSPSTSKNLTLLSEALRSFSGIKKLPNIMDFVNSLKQLGKVKIPSLKKLTDEVSRLAKAFYSLSAVSNVIHTLNRVANAVNKSGVEFDNFGRKVQKSTGVYEKFIGRMQNYVMYRVIADAIMMLQSAFKSAFQGLVEYDQALKDLQAITSATTGEVEQMGTVILQVASDTKFSAAEIATGMRTLGQAGFSAQEAMGAMNDISNLATGTLSTMEESVDLVSSALRIFGAENLSSSEATDVFANSVNRSKLTIDKMRTALNYVGPIAKHAGVSFQEMATAMSVLANSGLKASKIGTGLRRVISELVDPKEKLAIAAANAGVALDELNPINNSLSSVLKSLSVIVTDSGEAFRLFGKRGAAAALTLTQDLKQYARMELMIAETGTAAQMASIQVEGLGVKLKNISDKVGVLIVKLGEAGLTEAFRFVLTVVQKFLDVLIYLSDTAIGKFIIQTALMSAGILIAAKAMGVLHFTMKAMMSTNFINFLSNIATTLPLIGKHARAAAASIGVFRAATMGAAGAAGGLAAGTAAAGTAAAGATGGFLALGASLLYIGGFIAIIGALALAVKGAYNAYKNYTNGHREAAKEASKEVDETNRLVDSYDMYSRKLKELEYGSDLYKQKNRELRKSLIELSNEYGDAWEEARDAADSIEPITGMLLDQGEALEIYQQKLNDIKFDKLSEISLESEKSLSEVGNWFNRFTSEIDTYWVQWIGRQRYQWAYLKGLFVDNSKELADVLNKNSTELLESMDISYFIKLVRDGKDTYEDWERVLADFDPKNASGELKDIKKRFDEMNLSVWKSYEAFEKADNLDLTMSRKELIEFLKANNLIKDEADIMTTAYIKAYDKIIQANKNASDEVTRNRVKITTKEDLDRQIKDIEDFNEKAIARIELLLAKEEISQAEADERKLKLMQDYYNTSLALAIKHRDDLLKYDPKNAEAIEKANKEIEEIEHESYVKRLEAAKDFNEDLKKANDKVEENEKNQKKEVSNYKKFLNEIKDLEKKAADKIEDIWKKYNEKREKLREDLNKFLEDKRKEELAGEKALRDSIAGLEDSLADKIRKKRQEKMTDQQKEADNQKAYVEKMKEANDLLTEGIKKNDSELIERAKEKASQAQDLAEGFKDQEDSIKKMTKANDLLINSEKGLKEISDYERELDVKNKIRDVEKEIVDARNKAEEDAGDVSQSLKDELQERKNLIEEELGVRKDFYKTVQDAETARHKHVMENLQKEIDKYKSMSSIYGSVVEGFEAEGDPANVGMSNEIKKESEQVQTYLTKIGDTWTQVTDTMKSDSQKAGTGIKESISDASKGFDDFIVATTEDGKSFITTASSMASGISAFGKVVHTEALTPMNELKVVKEAINEEPIKLDAQTSGQYDKVLSETDEILDKIKENYKVNVDPQELEEARETASGISSEIEDKPIKVPVDKTEIESTSTELDNLSKKDIKVKGSIFAGDSSFQEVVNDINIKLSKLSDNTIDVTINLSDGEFDSFYQKVSDLSKKGVDVGVGVSISGKADMDSITTWLALIESKKDTKVGVTAEVTGTSDVMFLKQEIDNIKKSVTIKIIAQVFGIDKVQSLAREIAKLPTRKVVTVVTRHVTEGKKFAQGGFVQAFANGGQVFRRLANRYIGTGSGTKDDVPAMLMRGEFVHRTAAVKKYGRRFMEMVNRGLFPIDLARKAIRNFASGGPVNVDVTPRWTDTSFVQKFALGGSVLGGIGNNLRKKILELLGMNSPDINIKNDIINKYAGSTVTELGSQSINKMSETFNGAVAALASGGGIENLVGQMLGKRTEINSQFDNEINKAKSEGQNEIANILAKEKETLAQISLELTEELKKIKEEYDTYVSTRKEEHKESASERDSNYKEQREDSIESYNKEKENDTKSHNEKKADHEERKQERLNDLAEELEELENGDHSPYQYYQKLAELRKNITEAKEEFHTVGRLLSVVANPNQPIPMRTEYYDENGKPIRGSRAIQIWKKQRGTPGNTLGNENRKKIHDWVTGENYYWPKDNGEPDLDWIERTFKKLDGKQPAVSNLMDKYDTAKYNIKSTVDSVNKYLEEAGLSRLPDNNESLFLETWGKTYGADRELLQNAANKVSHNVLTRERELINSKYRQDQKEDDIDWSEYNREYKENTNERDSDHKEYITDLDKSYKGTVKEEKDRFKEDLENAKIDFKERTEEAKKEALSKSESVKEDTQKQILDVKDSVADRVKEADVQRKESIGGTKGIQELDAKSYIRDAMSPFEELLKKLKLGPFKFNTGGIVPHAPGSTPGKDSILAALTPGEVVIREPIVRMFGTDFFNSFNRMSIPRFNMGGVVGSIPDSVRESVMTREVKHVLDLSLNGENYGELYGERDTIEGFINGLTMAKMRTA